MAAIIFDFDGTIADSFELIVDFLIKRKKLGELTSEERASLRGLSMIAVAHQLGHRRRSMVRLFFAGRRNMSKRIDEVEAVDGIVGTIRQLKKEGHSLFIVSNNTALNVRRFLAEHDLEDQFDEVRGNAWVLGKRAIIARLIRSRHIDRNEVWYVGDEPNDVRAARGLAIRVIAVAWGFATLAAIMRSRPTATAHKPSDILEHIKSAAAKPR